MYCTNCGKEIDDDARFCSYCGAKTDNYQIAVNYQPTNEVKPEQKTNGLAIAGFVVGIVSLWLGVFFGITSVTGLILSTYAKKNREKYNRCNGLAVAGFIISIVSLGIWTLYWVLYIGVMYDFGGIFDVVY